MLRINIKIDPTKMPSKMARTMTIHTAKRATSGFPAPNSFDTRVLNKTLNLLRKSEQMKDKFKPECCCFKSKLRQC